MKQSVFDYRKHLFDKREKLYPACDLYVQGKDKNWYLFYPYVDSGADITLLTFSDAELLGFDLTKAKEIYLRGIGGRLKIYLFPVKLKVSGITIKTEIGFSESNETPRLLGRKDIFKRFVISFRESSGKTYFTTEPPLDGQFLVMYGV